jgi:hypothetical protein
MGEANIYRCSSIPNIGEANIYRYFHTSLFFSCIGKDADAAASAVVDASGVASSFVLLSLQALGHLLP